MLDMKFIRENPQIVKKACELKRMPDCVDEILALDVRVRELKTITQAKTAEKNKITREIPAAVDKAVLIARSKEIGAEIANDLAELAAGEEKLADLLRRVPQIPAADAPVGKDDTENAIIEHIDKLAKKSEAVSEENMLISETIDILLTDIIPSLLG